MGPGFRFLLIGALLAGVASPAAANCPCPKSKMIELYGTVSMFPPAEPGPRRKVARPDTSLPVAAGSTVPVTVVPSMVEVSRQMPTPTLDHLANPLNWKPVFIEQ
jgi:hypothetical protein